MFTIIRDTELCTFLQVQNHIFFFNNLWLINAISSIILALRSFSEAVADL